MNAELFKSVGMVAGIGGVALGVMLLVLRDIIKKNIFPKFKVEKNAYRLLRLIVISVWTVALLGIVTWGVTAVMTGREGDSITISNNDYSTEMAFADYDIIINQYQTIHGQDLSEELVSELRKAINLLKGGQYESSLPVFQKVSEAINVPAVHNNIGGLLALEAKPGAARAEYAKAIALDPEYEAAQLNLGLLEQSQGNYEQAERHLSKAESYAGARKLVRTMVKTREAGAIEQEPNDDRFQPNIAPLNEVIQASIKDGKDNDFYEISIPGQARDYVTIEVENQNLALKPRIGLYNTDRKWLGGTTQWDSQVTAGQNMRYDFVAKGGTKYLVWVGSVGGNGPYSLKISPNNRFDEYEPNEDLFNAKSIALGTDVEAMLLDTLDNDYYAVKLGATVSRVQVSIQNRSRNLKPRIGVYHSNRQWLGGTTQWDNQVTAGQDMTYSFQSEADGNYYVAVWSLGGSGDYVLRVEQS